MPYFPEIAWVGLLRNADHRRRRIRLQVALRLRTPFQGRSAIWRGQPAPLSAPSDPRRRAEPEWIVGGWTCRTASSEAPFLAACHRPTQTWFSGRGWADFLNTLTPTSTPHRMPSLSFSVSRLPSHRPAAVSSPSNGSSSSSDTEGSSLRLVSSEAGASTSSHADEDRVYRTRRWAEFLGPWSEAHLQCVHEAIEATEAARNARKDSLRTTTFLNPEVSEGQQYRWVCVVVQASENGPPYYYARTWMDGGTRVTARTAEGLARNLRATFAPKSDEDASDALEE